VAAAKGWTVEAKMGPFNKALDQYAKRFDVDHGKLIAWAALETVTRIEKRNPVATGRSRAGWLPFIWKNNGQAELRGSSPMAQQEGIRACRFKQKYTGSKPYARITNAVRYLPYLEYGTSRGGGGKLYSVSARMDKGFIRASIDEVHRAVKAKLKKGK
jgi:hypothetical protein